jgi:predicted RNA-binding Zn-ribbon protein involved in translation (DUF1610 family)
MDITDVRLIHTTVEQHQVNMLLRCNWILLDVREGKFVMGQTEKFRCPKCESEIDFGKVKIASMEGLHMIDCPQCGKEKIPNGVTLDQYFVDKITEYKEENVLTDERPY